MTILAFLRISTNPRILVSPLSMGDAVSAVARGPLLMDAHLAALAIENGAILCTSDRDFARFPSLVC